MGAFPFLYLDHGELDPDRIAKGGAVVLGFQAPVPERDRLRIQRSVPDAFAGFFRWSDLLFTSESAGDVFDAVIYGDASRGDPEPIQRFAAEVEAWVRQVHEQNPLIFFSAPSPVREPDAWGRWSREQAAAMLLPYLERYAETHPDSRVLDDDDVEASEPMGAWSKVDLGAMRWALQRLGADTLAGRDGADRVRALFARYGL
jgi:hypothetical protein